MAANYWVKLYIETLHDRKMGQLSDHLYRRTIEFILLAGENNRDGLLPSVEDMAWTLRADADELLDDLHALAEVKIAHWTEDGWVVTNFAKRQAASSDAERMRQMRARKQKEQYANERYDVVTNRNVESESDTESDKNKREGEAQPPDEFHAMQATVERLTGYTTKGGDDLVAIQEMVKLQVIEDDILGALDFFKSKGKTARGASSILESVKFHRAKRIQAASPKSRGPTSPPAKDLTEKQAAVLDKMFKRRG